MRKVFILFLSILFASVGNGQIALINDPDGYCNVRSGPDMQSKILDTLPNDRIVFIFSEQAVGNWLMIDYRKGEESHSGFVHKSRIKFLSDLTEFKQVTLNDTFLKLQLDSFQLTILKGKFSDKKRQLTYGTDAGEYKYLKSVDDKFPWGTEGNVPKSEYKTIQIKTGKDKMNFARKEFQDLFEPNLDATEAYYDVSSGKIFVEAWNSDAAGGYVAVWTIKSKSVIRRDIVIPF